MADIAAKRYSARSSDAPRAVRIALPARRASGVGTYQRQGGTALGLSPGRRSPRAVKTQHRPDEDAAPRDHVPQAARRLNRLGPVSRKTGLAPPSTRWAAVKIRTGLAEQRGGPDDKRGHPLWHFQRINRCADKKGRSPPQKIYPLKIRPVA